MLDAKTLLTKMLIALKPQVVSENGQNTSTTNNAVKNLCTVSLNKGTWLCIGTATWASNSSGRRGLYFSTTSGTQAGDGRFAQLELANAGSNEMHMQIVQIRTITADNTTLYLNGRQNGGSINVSYPGIQCVKIGA